jgi:hypothetical protein
MYEINTSQKIQTKGLFKFCVLTLYTIIIDHLNLNYKSCDSKIEHLSGLKLCFNSMFQTPKLTY